ncbi:hypothetical protein [Halomarina pelagica]|uniref:hypothetical protein n=1 Tax=Halomarina pelagica TaxID=2961599 RepID=UPI0020C552BB|nr:hypothetical protein [Halomarina sp. BND7]
MRWTGVRIALFVLDTFVAVTAIGGGIAMATGLDPLPDDWLIGTPFQSFLIPGALLAAVVGGSAAVAAFGVLRSTDAGAMVSVVAGALLMGWIVVEVLLLNQPSWTWTEAVYFVVGSSMVVLGFAHGWA